MQQNLKLDQIADRQNETNRALQFIVSTQPPAPQSEIHNSPS
jgi:hypothetical protein